MLLYLRSLNSHLRARAHCCFSLCPSVHNALEDHIHGAVRLDNIDWRSTAYLGCVYISFGCLSSRLKLGCGTSLGNPSSYNGGLFTPVEDPSALSERAYTTLVHPAFPRHSVRVKKSTEFCDTTVK